MLLYFDFMDSLPKSYKIHHYGFTDNECGETGHNKIET